MGQTIMCIVFCLIMLQVSYILAQNDTKICDPAEFNRYFACINNFNGSSVTPTTGISQNDYKSDIGQCFQKYGCNCNVSFYEDVQEVKDKADSIKQNDDRQQSCLNESFNSIKSSIEFCVRDAAQAFSGFTLPQPSPLKATGFHCSASSIFFVTSQINQIKNCSTTNDLNLCVRNVSDKCSGLAQLNVEKSKTVSYLDSRLACESGLSSNCSWLLSHLSANIGNCVEYESSTDSAAESFRKCTGNNGSLPLESLLTTAIRKLDDAASTLQTQEIIQKAKETFESISNSLFGPKPTNGQMPLFGGLPDGINSILSNLSFPNFGSNNYSIPQFNYSIPQFNYSLPNLGSFNFSSNISLPMLLTSLNLTAPQGLGNLTKGTLDNLFGQVSKGLGGAQGSLNVDSLVGQLAKKLLGLANATTTGINSVVDNKK